MTYILILNTIITFLIRVIIHHVGYNVEHMRIGFNYVRFRNTDGKFDTSTIVTYYTTNVCLIRKQGIASARCKHDKQKSSCQHYANVI